MSQVVTGSYVWGLDSSPGTFITDYILGCLCLLYGLCILSLYKGPFRRGSRWKKTKEDCSFAENQGREYEKGHQLILALSFMFLSCGLMNGVGALLHHFVSLIEPDYQLPATAKHLNLGFWNQMRLQLYPWYLVWQLANILALLYGIFTFLSAFFTVEFDLYLRNDFLETSVHEDKKMNNSMRKSRTIFQVVKKVTLWIIAGLFVLFVVFRFWRILEYRKSIFSTSSEDKQNGDLNVQEAKMDQEKMGIWSATAASTTMFLSFATSCALSTFMMLKGQERKISVTRSLASWMLLLGGILQLFYSASCGKNSPSDCPFPISFNHNAFYHVLQGVGMTLWFIAEWICFNRFSSVPTKIKTK